MTKPQPTASVTVKRPPEPITSTAMQLALRPMLDLLGIESADDVQGIVITPSRIRLTVVPRHRGRRQHDSVLRVSYPVVYDDSDD